MRWDHLFALAAPALLIGCAAPQAGPPQSFGALDGRTMDVRTAAGQTSTLRFAAGGVVRAVFDGREVPGRWNMEADELCFVWPGDFRECWPYAVPLRFGETRAITSSRGNRVTVTLR